MAKRPRGTHSAGPAKSATKTSSRNDQIVRVLRIIGDLSRSSGEDLYALADRYGTSTRTIRRDLQAIEQSGLVLRRDGAEDSPRARWSIDAAHARNPMQVVEFAHYLALRLALDEGRALKAHGALYSALQDVMDRVAEAIGPRGRAELKAIEACFFSWDKFAWRQAAPDVLWPLVEAIRSRNTVTVAYRAPTHRNEKSTLTVLPLRLFVHEGTLYLHAWNLKLEKVIVLNVRRVLRLTVNKAVAEVPPEYRPEAFEAAAFGLFIGSKPVTYRVRFDAEAASWIQERTWHPTQVSTPLPDGGVELTFTCAESYEVPAWVASWRQHAELLEPTHVRDEMKAYAQWLSAKYLGSASS